MKLKLAGPFHDQLWRGAAAGLTAGVVLALLLKWFQALTGKLVYTLLLNIDWLPYMPNRLPEAVELALHLAVALPIGIIYVARVAPLTKWHYAAGLLVGEIVAVATWLPLTQLSSRVPKVTDFSALLLWLIGHAAFGLLLAWLAMRLGLAKQQD